MAKSSATTVDEYLAELPEDRRESLSRVREVVLRNLPAGYEERMNWGMISYEVPLERYPKTYNGQPLGYAALASQKNYCALYLTAVYGDEAQERQLCEGFAAAGKKLDMGKSCIRFRTPDDLALDAIAHAVAATTPDQLIAIHEKVHPR